MKITLDSNPIDAPCCVKIVAEDGRDRLIQTDWDFPGIASSFGWSVREVQLPHKHGQACAHSGTDGTIDCSECGLKAGDFISAAREWLDDHDGEETEDPGYFE